MNVADLLALPGLRLELLTGDTEALSRELRWVYTTDLLEPEAFLTGGELVLTSEGWYREPADCALFAASLSAGGAAAVVAGDLLLGEVPPALAEACGRHGLPLLAAAAEVSYSSLSRTVIDRINHERGRELGEMLGRHRRLVQALVDGADLGGLTAMLATELGRDCWVLSPAGRLLAGPPAALPAGSRAALSAAAQRSGRLPATVTADASRPGSAGPADRRPAAVRYTVLPIGRRGSGGGHLVVAGELLASDEVESATQTAELLALGGARRDERRRTEQHFLTELVALVESGAPAAVLTPRLRAAGLAVQGPYLVLTATSLGSLRPWDLAADLVESALDHDPQVCAVVAGDGRGLTVLVSLGGVIRDDLKVAELLRERFAVLAGATGDGRISFGLSGTVSTPGGLLRALEEARHAGHLAGLGAERLSLVTARDLDSHLLLLAGVPVEIRRAFRRRLLGPLEEYDRTHGAEFLRTLEVFLEHNGAWRTTAAELHIHVSTLHYRIGRVEQLTGRDLSHARDRVDLHLACAITDTARSDGPGGRRPGRRGGYGAGAPSGRMPEA
ncbi:helix-turn-helix domain-containing protein [Streptomyces sp. NPDC059398]|uniref:helix-turn-helix domain-containing protein n=1 Tax=Streptomyces sp. NPDC059398 TaxID=3346820 RepID=UPI0036BE795F